MIKKSRWKFVATIMIILLCVFTTIYVGVYLFMNKSMNKIAAENIENAIKSYSPFPTNPHIQPDVQPNGLIFFIEDRVLICDEDAYTEEQINSLYRKTEDISATQQSSIKNENEIFYTITKINGKTALVAINMKSNIKILNETRQNIFFALLLVYILLFVLVYFISYKVFEPLKKALDNQKQFISNASHELKTPITIISASTDVLKHTSDNQWLTNIKSQTERLNSLVADMLTLAKMDEKNIALNNETFNLSQEILNAVLPFDALAYEKNKNLITNLTQGIELKGDRSSVKKVVSILLDNAIKHASVGGEIIVELKKENKQILFSVYNTGSAVKEENADKIFERFYRSDDSRSRESGGSGLGLSIAKGICDTNKWKINAKCKLNEFMKITVIFHNAK